MRAGAAMQQLLARLCVGTTFGASGLVQLLRHRRRPQAVVGATARVTGGARVAAGGLAGEGS